MEKTRVVMNSTGPGYVHFSRREKGQAPWSVGGGGKCTTPVYREKGGEAPITLSVAPGTFDDHEEFAVTVREHQRKQAETALVRFPQDDVADVPPIPGSSEAVAQAAAHYSLHHNNFPKAPGGKPRGAFVISHVLVKAGALHKKHVRMSYVQLFFTMRDRGWKIPDGEVERGDLVFLTDNTIEEFLSLKANPRHMHGQVMLGKHAGEYWSVSNLSDEFAAPGAYHSKTCPTTPWRTAIILRAPAIPRPVKIRPLKKAKVTP